jgi:hypothetical protein
MDPARSNIGAKLTLVALVEYTRALYKDFYRAKSNIEKRDFQKVQSVQEYLQVRYTSPNVLVTLSEWISKADPNNQVCVNPLSHTKIMEFATRAEAQTHRRACVSG